eukprot:GHVQ01014232.1.p2 GENE.GHVQ01014232.1~~GHVQ01014232.1.p2  ORF type:complete len:434 (+),score=54.29 GHVQ01014232.1:844-2145(+)
MRPASSDCSSKLCCSSTSSECVKHIEAGSGIASQLGRRQSVDDLIIQLHLVVEQEKLAGLRTSIYSSGSGLSPSSYGGEAENQSLAGSTLLPERTPRTRSSRSGSRDSGKTASGSVNSATGHLRQRVLPDSMASDAVPEEEDSCPAGNFDYLDINRSAKVTSIKETSTKSGNGNSMRFLAATPTQAEDMCSISRRVSAAGSPRLTSTPMATANIRYPDFAGRVVVIGVDMSFASKQVVLWLRKTAYVSDGDIVVLVMVWEKSFLQSGSAGEAERVDHDGSCPGSTTCLDLPTSGDSSVGFPAHHAIMVHDAKALLTSNECLLRYYRSLFPERCTVLPLVVASSTLAKAEIGSILCRTACGIAATALVVGSRGQGVAGSDVLGAASPTVGTVEKDVGTVEKEGLWKDRELGSVASFVVTSADCPVIVVKKAHAG